MNLDARNSPAPATPVVSRPNPLSDLPDEVDALVIGGGIAGLSAAWQLSQDGLKPLLVEARGYLGGLIAPGYIGPVQVDLGAETFVPRGVETAQMVAALGLESLAPSGDGARLFLPPTAPMVKVAGVCGASCVTPTWAFLLIRARTTSPPFWALRLRNVPPKTAT